MTAKEKADELIYQMANASHEDYCLDVELTARKCALLTADTVLSVIDIYPKHQMSASEIEAVEYWKNVKSEIEKL
jgi:hypothetical protein